jgi:hypothetical protein
MRLLIISIGGVLLFLGIILSLPPVVLFLEPPPMWEHKEVVLLDNAVLRVPTDSEITKMRYPVYGRHEFREICTEGFPGDYTISKNIKLRLDFTELGGHAINFYVIEDSKEVVLSWENRYKWEKAEYHFGSFYERKSVVSDHYERGVGLLYAARREGFCFIAENPNKEDILVQVSAILSWEYEANAGQRARIGGIIFLIGVFLFLISIPILIVGFVLPSKTAKRPPPPP